MRARLAYFIKAVLIEWALASVLAPLLLLIREARWGTSLLEPLLRPLREDRAASLLSGPFRSPDFVAGFLWVWALMAFGGFLFARFARPPESWGGRFLPLLTLPLAAALLWAWLLYANGGDYSYESDWRPLSLLIFSPHEVLFYFWEALFDSDGAPRWPWALNMNPESGIRYIESFMRDASGPAGALSLEALFILGFAAGRAGPRRAASRRGLAPLAGLGLLVAATLGRQLYDRAESIIGRREYWVNEDKRDPALLDYQACLNPDGYDPFHSESEGLLASLDKPAALRLPYAYYPRLDGATAFAPIYGAAMKATCRLPEGFGWKGGRHRFQGKMGVIESLPDRFSVSTSREGYQKLFEGQADIFFGLGPSAAQARAAAERGLAPRLMPIAREAFVFLTSADNPADSITLEQARGVYEGKILNWKELGGRDEPITAFQRPADSGSQTIMEERVMLGRAMKRPWREELIGEMLDLVTRVAEYHNGRGSLGYSFRWYAAHMCSVPGLKFLALNGVAPTRENIASGAYPLTVPIYAITVEGRETPETEALLAWLTGPEGRELITRAGYAP